MTIRICESCKGSGDSACLKSHIDERNYIESLLNTRVNLMVAILVALLAAFFSLSDRIEYWLLGALLGIGFIIELFLLLTVLRCQARLEYHNSKINETSNVISDAGDHIDQKKIVLKATWKKLIEKVKNQLHDIRLSSKEKCEEKIKRLERKLELIEAEINNYETPEKPDKSIFLSKGSKNKYVGVYIPWIIVVSCLGLTFVAFLRLGLSEGEQHNPQRKFEINKSNYHNFKEESKDSILVERVDSLFKIINIQIENPP